MGLDNNEKLSESQQSTTSPVKVLIADDDAPTRILLRAAISQWGYEVIEAADGEEAWELLQKEELPKLMIVDWLMPKLDGIDLCRRIKAELDQHPYIILLTQLSGTTNIVKGLEAGANEFLSKPFNMAELQSRLAVGSRIVGFEDRVLMYNKQLPELLRKATDMCEKLKHAVAEGEKDSLKVEELKEIQKHANDIETLLIQLNTKNKE